MKIRTTTMASSSALVGILLVFGASVVVADGRYWQDSNGNPIVAGNGQCVRAALWTTDGYTPGCDPKPKEAEVAKFVTPAPSPPAPIVQKLTLAADALFDFDSSQLGLEGKQALRDLANKLDAVDEITSISIAGYTDSIGPEDYNQTLSEKRAYNIKEQLVEAGVDPDIVSVQGFGESDPVASNATREGRAQNRRVIVTIEAKKKVSQ